MIMNKEPSIRIQKIATNNQVQMLMIQINRNNFDYFLI